MAVAPELVPFAGRVVLRQLLIPFTALVAYMFGWGLCQAIDALVRGLFGTAEGIVGWVPFAGRILSSPIHAIEHKVVSLVGGWASHFENQFFTRWHALGQVIHQLAADVEAAATLDYRIARRIALAITRPELHALLKTLHSTGKVVTEVTHTITKRVTVVEKIAAHAAPASVARSVGAVAGELDHVITWDIPRIRARERALTDEVGRLWKRVRGRTAVLGASAAAALVAVALGRLGIGWVRCSNWKRLGRTVCRTPVGDLEALLGLFAAGAVVADFRELVKLGQRVEHGVATVLQDVAKL